MTVSVMASGTPNVRGGSEFLGVWVGRITTLGSHAFYVTFSQLSGDVKKVAFEKSESLRYAVLDTI